MCVWINSLPDLIYFLFFIGRCLNWVVGKPIYSCSLANFRCTSTYNFFRSGTFYALWHWKPCWLKVCYLTIWGLTVVLDAQRTINSLQVSLGCILGISAILLLAQVEIIREVPNWWRTSHWQATLFPFANYRTSVTQIKL